MTTYSPPEPADLQRILSLTGELACTAPSNVKKLRRRHASVEKTMRRHAFSRKAIAAGLGHMRYRGRLNASTPPSCELFGQAYFPK
jgi:hypothetical protein